MYNFCADTVYRLLITFFLWEHHYRYLCAFFDTIDFMKTVE
jgi:hypothetical protein